MLSALRDLIANLRAGTRLALFLPVRARDFRISATQIALLAICDLALDTLARAAVAGFAGVLAWEALPGAFQPLLLALAGGVAAAWLARDERLALALPLLASSGAIAFACATWAVPAALDAGWLPEAAGDWFDLAFLIWPLLFLLRCAALLVEPLIRRFAAGLLLAGALLGGSMFWPPAEFWQTAPEPEQAAADDLPSPLSEEVLALQPRLLARDLEGLAGSRPGLADLYFVGFAPYAGQDVFMKEVSAARELMEERFGAAGRSLALISNRRTLYEAPMATVTNLRASLRAVAAAMDPEEDILFLFITTHGAANHELASEFGPLELQQLTPKTLAALLRESGFRWKVVVISACYSGGYVEALRDAGTLVITAADASRQSFGCGAEEDFTYFGRAYFDQALRRETSFIRGFELAREAIAAREQAEGKPASSPQMAVGEAIAGKLEAYEHSLHRIVALAATAARISAP